MDQFMFQSTESDDNQPTIEEVLSFPIQLTEKIRTTITDCKSFKVECSVIGKQSERLSQMLRSIIRFADSTPNLYQRPIRRIYIDVSRNLNRSFTLLRKCRRRSFFRRFISIVTVADFRKVCNLLDVSIGDLTWLISVFIGDEESEAESGIGEGIIFTLPPIASNDPVLAWIWSYIASLYLSSMNVKIEVAYELCSLTRDNDRNKNMIVEEGGIPPLLKLLKEEISVDAQIACAKVLFNLANNQYRSRLIFNEHGVPILVQVFRESSILVQIQVAKLIARMAEYDSVCQQGFATESVIGLLVMFLSFDVNVDEDECGKSSKGLRKSIGSVDEITKLMERSSITSNYKKKRAFSSFKWSQFRKDNENDSPEIILEFKTNCSRALWMIARGSIETCRKITETKGLRCLAELIEREKGELQINCLMTVLEITSAAEHNPDFRRSAFKTNSPAAKLVAEQLIRLINQSDNLAVKIPAIQAIGHLARTFPARQTQAIGPLVKQLCHRNSDVITESVIALGKFTCPENYLSAEHSKTVVDFEGVQPVMRLLRGDEKTQYHALKLVCYLSMNAGSCESVQQTRLLTALEGADKSVACQYPELRELVAKAIHRLNMSQAGLIRSQSRSYSRR